MEHGDVIRVGSSRLLVHIHEGHECCGQCDPETVQSAMQAAEVPVVSATTDASEAKPDQPENASEETPVFLTGRLFSVHFVYFLSRMFHKAFGSNSRQMYT